MMATAPESELPDIRSVIPEPLWGMKRWLLWRAEPHPSKPGKVRKIPVYVNGRQRKGLLDTEADLAQLATLDDAIEEYQNGNGKYAGIGFALSGDGVAAFDLDGVLDGNGELIMTHPGADLAIQAEIMGCYLERSPSKTGLRIVGPCDNPNWAAYSRDGVEAWSQKRFITLTADCWANPGGWVKLDTLRDPLGDPADKPEPRKQTDDDEIVTPETIETLRDALEAIPSDDRGLWVRIGQALKTLPNNKGFDLWIEWSKKSKKYNAADARHKWQGFGADYTHWRAVFVEAQAKWDWVNPKKGQHPNRDARDAFAEEDEDTPASTVSTNRVDFGDLDVLHPTEFILDGFLPVGVSVVAGAWGAGKSVNLIPLLASVAHLAPDEWGFRPVLRRKVIWVSEAPEQARDTLFSLARAEGSAPASEFKNWFYLFRAVRQSPRKLAKALKALIEGCTYSLDNGFVVNPVIALDTTSANIEIENESDNSMVSEAMAILKQAMPGISIILVGHTPKALVKADVNDMTFRGAGAWEADAVATYFLIYDQDTESRYLAVRKCRFNPTYREIDFGNEGGSLIVDTPWGEPQSKTYLHGVPTKSDGSQRRQAQEEAREERREAVRERTLTDRQQRIMAFVSNEVEAGRAPTKSTIRQAVGGKPELIMEALTRLVEAELVAFHPWDTSILGVTRSQDEKPLILPAEVELDLFLQRVAAQNT